MRMIIIYNLRMNQNSNSIASNSSTTPASKSVEAVVQSKPLGVTRYSSQALFSGAKEVEIDHNGALYRLRLTALGKLILTK